ncbi:hypothetical protein J5X84_27520 [Streptosporangiaceae bacterium NEAU-GS5]|nr:hypothetical protein [Streptosporangiaceae bacterium NEAU-GS5]
MFTVGGLIGIRWREWGGADGPFGAALTGEDPIAGTAGRRQRFEHGEMVWAPEQDMLVSAFRQRNDVCLQWSIPHFDHAYFRCNSFFNGRSQGLHEKTTLRPIGVGSDLQIWLRLQEFGDYDFHVAAFNDDDHTVQGWTATVHIKLGLVPGVAPPPFPVNPPFVERWHELGAGEGLMGLPTSAAEAFAGPGSTAFAQNFERGQVITHFALGPDFLMSAHQVNDVIEVNWGGFTTAYDKFRVDITRNGSLFRQAFVEDVGLEWVRTGRGSGRLRFEPPPGDAIYSFVVNPGFTSVIEPGDLPLQATAPVTVRYVQPETDALLEPLPLDGSHGMAFASHTVRARAIARHYVRTRRMNAPTGVADENATIQLIAHLHVLSLDPDFRIPGELPHKVVVNTLLRSSFQGLGAMGTQVDERPLGPLPIHIQRPGDYDMALKGLMVVLHRYRHLLNAEQVDYIVRDLIPPRLPGRIDFGFELYQLATTTLPETENHLLMMNSSKYLINKILFARTGDGRYDNDTNGVRDWLLRSMANFARHDFMEFNSRVYERMSLHVMLNLHEFGDPKVQTAAQIVLDYIMTKFAVSSSRCRRVPPFRRKKGNVNKADNAGNELIGGNVDQASSLFLTYVGPTAPDRRPLPTFLRGWALNGVIAGLAAYRPPPAAYIIAQAAHPPVQHRFYHGERPEILAAGERAEGGVELYYSSTSFLLSAGGMFLNSGYGRDEFQGFEQVAIAQSTTLIPVRADATFGELIRFEPYPGDRDADGNERLQREAVDTGVHLGFACGANLEVPDRWLDLANASWDGPWLLLDLNKDLFGPFRDAAPPLGFYVAIYRTPVDDPPPLSGLYGSVPRSFGWLYAMEATMPFETFAARIRSRNTFPAELDWDAKYTFTTPEEPAHTYEFWIRPDLEKYKPRITKVDGQPLLASDFTSLPLVQGPYLQASRLGEGATGHEGHLEIRGPNQDPASAPLVLDYRQKLDPRRTDNADSWPQPLLDRARALIDFARFLATLPPPRLDDAIDTLDGFDPPADMAAEYTIVLAELQHQRIDRLIAEGKMTLAGALTPKTLATYKLAATAPGADVPRIAGDLNQLSASMANNDRPHEAVLAQQALVEILDDHNPPPGQLLSYAIMLAEARHNLIVRLIGDDQVGQAAALVTATIGDYRSYSSLPDADLLRIGSDFNQLAASMANNDRPHEAVLAQQALVEILDDHNPPPGQLLSYAIMLAEARHNLIVRLIGDDQVGQAAALVAATLTDYRHYTTLPDADLFRIAGDLNQLAASMANSDRPHEAVQAQQTLVDILDGHDALPGQVLQYAIVQAEARHNLIVRLIGDDQVGQAAALVTATIGDYRSYSSLPDADLLRIGSDFNQLAASMANNDRPHEAVLAQQALVEILDDHNPPPGQLLSYAIMLAEARHNLIVRLIGDDQVGQAAALVTATIGDYRSYSSLPDADLLRIGSDFNQLAASMANNDRPHEAVLAQQALVEILDDHNPPPGQLLSYAIMLAEARHNLIVRLIGDDQVGQAAALVAATLTDYRHYTTLPDADLFRIAGDLNQLSASMANSDRPHEAVHAQQTLVDILDGHDALPGQVLQYAIMLAEARHNLIVRLIGDGRVGQAAALVTATIGDYRSYSSLPDADLLRVASDLNQLAAQLTSAGLVHEAGQVREAAVSIVPG